MITTRIAKLMIPRNVLFFFFTISTIILYYRSFVELMSLSLKSELYSHIILIPVISGYFLYRRRKSVGSEANLSVFPGAGVVSLGVTLGVIGLSRGMELNPNDRLSLAIFSAVTLWIGGFVLLYGPRAFRVAAFPFLFLFFLTPIPSGIIEKFILALQVASTEVSHLFFRLSGVPVLREGFTFRMSGLSIEVASQCSGIRSSIALVITSVIAGELFLRSGWRRWVLVLSVFPITVLKNGLRIVTLSLLGNYVDPRILVSELHKSGGIPFFIVGLLFFAPLLWFLMRSEKGSEIKGGGWRLKDKG